jgi:YkoY family integral membrane protein
MNELLQQIIDNPLPSLAVIGNLIIIESLLSVDNAAVLATMVMDLPEKDRSKALRYGIWGAYIFRGLAMLFAAFLIGIWWLKPLGGMYLLWLFVDQFKHKWKIGERGSMLFKILSLGILVYLIKGDPTINPYLLWSFRGLSGIFIIYQLYALIRFKSEDEGEEEINKSDNAVYQFFQHKIGPFWSTIILVEIMDMAFSIDNVFAAVAFTPNIILVCVGVFIGILAMRFVAQTFVKLMEKYTFLETAAFIVIAILGVKLILSLYEHFYPETPVSIFLGGHSADILVSSLTVAIFFIPIITSLLFNFPKKTVLSEHEVKK